jgi:hypothetical protein
LSRTGRRTARTRTKVSQLIRNTYLGMSDTDSSIVLDREEDSEDEDKGEPADQELVLVVINQSRHF